MGNPRRNPHLGAALAPTAEPLTFMFCLIQPCPHLPCDAQHLQKDLALTYLQATATQQNSHSGPGPAQDSEAKSSLACSLLQAHGSPWSHPPAHPRLTYTLHEGHLPRHCPLHQEGES